ncbi:MAG: prolyl oligopeptidase family serine peptidase [Mangrovibacterium sp.]
MAINKIPSSILTITIIEVMVTLDSCNSLEGRKNANNFRYPEMKKENIFDEYFGTIVEDPYRWLEDDNSEETKAWVEKENTLTFDYLDKIPFRDAIKKRLTDVWDYESISAPSKSNNYWLEFRNNGKQNQSVLYYRKSLEEEASILLDPNKLSTDGTVALNDCEISKDGNYLAYSISRSGSDWQEIFVMNIATKELLSDHILWAKFTTISWFENGFFYTKYPEPIGGEALKGANVNAQIYYHALGTHQSADQLVYEDQANPKWGYHVNISKDEKYGFLYTSESTSGNKISIFKPKTSSFEITDIVADFKKKWNIVGTIGARIFVLTNWNASRYQLLELDAENMNLDRAKVIIPEAEETLEGVKLTGNKLFCFYLKDAKSLVKVHDNLGNFERDVDIEISSVSGFSGDCESTITFYTSTSFISPAKIYKYKIATGESTLYRQCAIQFDESQFETKQVFYESKDGTMVPMFITYKKGLEKHGKNPTLLYGYGGFDISMTPIFNIMRIPWLENGGILAVANIRGGGEYGENWHKSGTKLQKQNVFDDFISAVEYLQKENYTCPAKTAIQGGSNGGLLVAACLTQQPDLFAVALPAVGVLDMLRYQKFTIGRYWATDYGMSDDSKEMFDYLYAYSPLHNVKDGQTYPATLITTADHDDRVVPAHSFKFAATMQEKTSSTNPILIMISKNAGHGAGKPKTKLIEEYANIWAFTLFNMGEEYK